MCSSDLSACAGVHEGSPATGAALGAAVVGDAVVGAAVVGAAVVGDAVVGAAVVGAAVVGAAVGGGAVVGEGTRAGVGVGGVDGAFRGARAGLARLARRGAGGALVVVGALDSRALSHCKGPQSRFRVNISVRLHIDLWNYLLSLRSATNALC